MNYKEFHDATLQTIQLHWIEGTVRVDVIYFKGNARRRGAILGTNVSGVSCPRAFPWGESQSINEVSSQERSGRIVLRIEMQSGDELVIQASAFFLKEGTAIE